MTNPLRRGLVATTYATLTSAVIPLFAALFLSPGESDSDGYMRAWFGLLDLVPLVALGAALFHTLTGALAWLLERQRLVVIASLLVVSFGIGLWQARLTGTAVGGLVFGLSILLTLGLGSAVQYRLFLRHDRDESASRQRRTTVPAPEASSATPRARP